MSPQQHGFLRRRPSLSNLLVKEEAVTRMVDGGYTADVIYPYFAKVFGSVNRASVMSSCFGLKHTFMDGGEHSGGIPSARWCSAGPTPVSPFRERPSRCPRSTGAALSNWGLGGHRTRTCTVILLLHGIGRRNGTYRSILPNATISALVEKSPWDLFPDGSGTPISVSKLVLSLC